jgi:hypothetical protein
MCDQDFDYYYLLRFVQELSLSLRNTIEEVLDSLTSHERCAVLSILASFNTSDVIDICKAFHNIDTSIGSGTELNFPRKRLSFILVICRHFLSTLSLAGAVEGCRQQSISISKYSSNIDGIYTRSYINEILLDLEGCQTDLRQIVDHVPTDQVMALPGSCGYQTLRAACRLPLIESKWPQWSSIATSSFMRCIDSEGVFRRWLPMSLVLALTVVAANMHINAALQQFQQIDDSPNKIGLDFEFNMFEYVHENYEAGNLFFQPSLASTVMSPNQSVVDDASTGPTAKWPASIQTELLIAYNILQVQYLGIRSSKESIVETVSSERGFLEPFQPGITSMLHYLPEHLNLLRYTDTADSGDIHDDLFNYKVSTNPLSLASALPRSMIGILLAALTRGLYTHCGIELEADDAFTTTTAGVPKTSSPIHGTEDLEQTEALELFDDPEVESVEELILEKDSIITVDDSQAIARFDIELHVHSLVYWGFHLELKPGPLALWNLAYACLGVHRLQEGLDLLHQCHEQLISWKHLYTKSKPLPLHVHLEEFLSRHPNDMSSCRSGVTERSGRLQNSSFKQVASLDLPSIQLLVANISPFEQHIQLLLQWLGMHAQPLQFPWLPASSIAEIILRCRHHERLASTVQLLQATLLDFFDEEYGGELLSLVLNCDNSADRKSFLKLSDLIPIILENGLNEEVFTIDLESFRESLSNSKVLSRMRLFTSSNVPAFVHSIGTGLLLTLLQYAKCHAEISRVEHLVIDLEHSISSSTAHSVRPLTEQERSFHKHVAVRCLSVLFELVFDSTCPLHIPVEVEGDILLHFVIILGEIHDPGVHHGQCLMLLKQLLRSPTTITDLADDVIPREKVDRLRNLHPQWFSYLHPKFVHLLALSLTRDSHDPESFAIAISLLKNNIFQQFTQTRRSTLQFNRTEFEGGEKFSPLEQQINDRNIQETLKFRTWNLRYTIALLLFHSGDYLETVTFADNLVRDIRDFMQFQQTVMTSSSQQDSTTHIHHVASRFHVILPCYFHNIHEHREVVVTKSSACRLLFSISRLCCALGKFSVSKSAVAEAYRIMYSIDSDIVSRLEKLSTQDNISDHEAIDVLKFIPTMPGWRVFSGCGLSDRRDITLEADALCECAQIIQAEERTIEDSRHRVGDLLNLAISICPSSARAQCGLAALFLDRHRRDYKLADNISDNTDLSPSVTTALQFVKKALVTKATNPEVW